MAHDMRTINEIMSDNEQPLELSAGLRSEVAALFAPDGSLTGTFGHGCHQHAPLAPPLASGSVARVLTSHDCRYCSCAVCWWRRLATYAVAGHIKENDIRSEFWDQCRGHCSQGACGL